MARYPVDSPDVASGYGYRQDPRGGLLPQGHYALDLRGAAGTAVRAPEAATVTAVWTDDTPPWKGYGPGGVELSGESGVYHVLAHMDPAHLEVSVGDHVMEGEQVGVMSTMNHVHWEVRHVAVDNPDTRAGDTEDPRAWLAREDPAHMPPVSVPAQSRGKLPWWAWVGLLWLLSKGKLR
jgi:murein DD-endopeptidase MepM/ murein hydrolase activator NlpD